MIRNVEEAIQATADWIQTRARVSRAQSLVLGISGGVDSAVVAGICARTNLPVVGVIMPCHSSPASIARAEEVIKAFGLKRHFVDLAAAHDTIVSQVTTDLKKEDVTSRDRNWVHGALRSCLRAPTLDFVTKAYEGIIVGTGNRDEDEVTRYFQKRGDGCVDISPISKYHKSEVYQLAQALSVPISVISAVPSADLWGPDSGQEDEKELGITYPEIEWAMQFAQRYSSIPLTTTGGVTSVQLNGALTMARNLGVDVSHRQERVLITLMRLEETSRHKANPNLPVFDARAELALDIEPVTV
jgi:NAD+ synthase